MRICAYPINRSLPVIEFHNYAEFVAALGPHDEQDYNDFVYEDKTEAEARFACEFPFNPLYAERWFGTLARVCRTERRRTETCPPFAVYKAVMKREPRPRSLDELDREMQSFKPRTRATWLSAAYAYSEAPCDLSSVRNGILYVLPKA
jgi:hypothetical protein